MKNVFSISHKVNNSRPHCHCEAFPIVVRRTEDFILRFIFPSHSKCPRVQILAVSK